MGYRQSDPSNERRKQYRAIRSRLAPAPRNQEYRDNQRHEYTELHRGIKQFLSRSIEKFGDRSEELRVRGGTDESQADGYHQPLGTKPDTF